MNLRFSPTSYLNISTDIYKKIPTDKFVCVLRSKHVTPRIKITHDTQLSHGTAQDEKMIQS